MTHFIKIRQTLLIDIFTQVLLTPNSGWGGEGSLGCGIGFGYLHRIPVKEQSTQPQDPEMGGTGQARDSTTDGPAEGYADVRL